MLFRFFIIALITGAAGYALVKIARTTRPERKTASTGTAISALPPAPDTASAAPHRHAGRLSYTVKRGDAFAIIMRRLNVAPDRTEAFHRALAAAGLSKLYPDDSLTIIHDEKTSLISISYLNRRLQCRYNAEFRDSVVVAEKQPLHFTIRRCLLNGVLETSLLDAMNDYGLGAFLACRLSDIFAWDINFFLDPRKGDSFQVIFEQKYAEGKLAGYGDIIAARYRCKGTNFFAIGFPENGGELCYYDSSGRSVQKEFLKAPLRFSRISSGFSYRRKHPILGIVRPHCGIDYAAPTGTPVYAAADGKIVSAGWDKSYGKNVVISHGGSFSTYYGHLASFSAGIHAGVYVKQGRMIGAVGATGLATGPHLDYRMKKSGIPINPLTINLPSKRGIGSSDAAAFNRIKESSMAVFQLRYPQRLGCHIIDIHHASERDSSEATPQQFQVSINGISSDS